MFYKFLRTADIDRVLKDGTIVVSSLKYFRDLEDTQKPGIADRLEGATELTVSKQLTLTENSPDREIVERANIGLGRFKDGFARVSGGGRINFMKGASFVHTVPNKYIYSFSDGNLDELKKAMCVEASEPYDACLRIADPEALRKAILAQGEVLETKAAVSTIFGGGALGKVSYEEVVRDIRSGPAITPSPLRKAPRFASQSEHRLVFDPTAEGLSDRIIIKIPEAGKHFQELFRDFKP